MSTCMPKLSILHQGEICLGSLSGVSWTTSRNLLMEWLMSISSLTASQLSASVLLSLYSHGGFLGSSCVIRCTASWRWKMDPSKLPFCSNRIESAEARLLSDVDRRGCGQGNRSKACRWKAIDSSKSVMLPFCSNRIESAFARLLSDPDPGGRQ